MFLLSGGAGIHVAIILAQICGQRNYKAVKRIYRMMKNDSATKRLQIGAASLLKSVCESEHAGFAEGRAEYLKADGEFSLNFAAGNGDAGDAGEGAGYSVDVGEVHLEWIAGAFAELESRNR